MLPESRKTRLIENRTTIGEETKANEIDQDFREQIKNDKVHTCEKHVKAEGMEIVLTEHFCQDLVEEYFRKQHQLGRSNNPEIHHFGDNSNTIRIERSISSSRLSSRVGSFQLKHE